MNSIDDSDKLDDNGDIIGEVVSDDESSNEINNSDIDNSDDDINDSDLNDDINDSDVDDYIDDNIDDDGNQSESDNDIIDSDEEYIDESEEFNLQNDLDNEYAEVPKEKRVTKPILTKYEFNRVLGIRLKHVTMGAKLLISTPENMSHTEMVKQELKEKKTPLVIKRNLPNNKYELWKINELTIPDMLFL